MLSILFNSSNYKIKIKNGPTLSFSSYKYSLMLSLLGILTFSIAYSFNSDKKLEIFFDTKNKFIIPLNDLSIENENLILTLFGGIRHGADFVINENIDFKNYRSKTFKISIYNNKKSSRLQME